MTTVSPELRTAVRVANRTSARRQVGLRWLFPLVALPVLLTCTLLGGLAAVITTVPTLALLVLLYLPVVAWAARSEPDARWARVVWIGFGAKLAGYGIRYLVITEVYGTGDSKSFHAAGAVLARSYRAGELGATPPGIGGEGTAAIKVITGLVYSVTGPSLLIGGLVFSLLSFTGVLWLVKAFRIGVADGDHLRYCRLVLLLPSMWFWPSSLGKDAWMLFGLGMLAYGAARLYSRAPGGLVMLGTGTALCALVRPHIALVALGAAAVALMLRSRGGRRHFNRIGKVVVLLPLVVGGLALVSKSERFLKVEDSTVSGLQAAARQVGKQSGQGGSAFTPTPVTNLGRLPVAAVTVLYRPFPFEARNALAGAISLEASFLLLLTVVSWRRVLGGLLAMRRSPYLALCALAILAFIVAFSNFANFGILARERVQVLPFAVAFLAAGLGRRSTSPTVDSAAPKRLDTSTARRMVARAPAG